jgi:Flp pilus assembly pilin Flp
MDAMRLLLVRILAQLFSERGQTLSEYAIIIVWIALVIIVGATKLGSSVSHVFGSEASRL